MIATRCISQQPGQTAAKSGASGMHTVGLESAADVCVVAGTVAVTETHIVVEARANCG